MGISFSAWRQYRFSQQIKQTRDLLASPQAWGVLDQLGVPGFGTQLIRLLFPHRPAKQPAWGFGKPAHPTIAAVLAQGLARYRQQVPTIATHSKDVASWATEFDVNHPEQPYLKNEFFPLCDAIVLYGMLQQLRPKQYLEIGSGMSTKIANQARKGGNFSMEITSIDPEPRAEIDSICDVVIRSCLEEVDETLFSKLTPGSVLFFDGSHHCFPGNDVVLFFLKILPNLPAGVIVHIHDIYWPDDYAPEFLKFLWSEQYLLGAWLMGGGQGIEILFPAAFMSKQPEMVKLLDQLGDRLQDSEITQSAWHRQGTSFWVRKV